MPRADGRGSLYVIMMLLCPENLKRFDVQIHKYSQLAPTKKGAISSGDLTLLPSSSIDVAVGNICAVELKL